VLSLNDNSRLLGEMPAQTLTVDSPTLGSLKVALERVSLIRVERDGAQVFLRNGDKVQGKPSWKEVKLTTKIGELTVPLSQLRQLETFDADGVPSTLGDGLVLHLRFDRANNAVKIHDAKPAIGHRGKPKSALEFDGKKSWVEIPNERRLSRQITMCAWIKQTGTGEQTGVILAAMARQKPSAGLAVSASEGVGLALALEGDGGSGELQHPADLSEWTLVVGTYDGVTSALYVNGQQVQTQRAPGTLAGRAGRFVVGGSPDLFRPEPEEPAPPALPVPENVPAPAPGRIDERQLPVLPVPENVPAPAPAPAGAAGAGEVVAAAGDIAMAVDAGELMGWFKGLIDEVRVYDRALNADEVRALYEATQ
jgi:hypothetical protein